MYLLNGNIGMSYTVHDVNIEEGIARRLQALGLTEGTKICILNQKKNGTLICKVRGTRLAVGKRIARGIEINGGVQGGEEDE